MSQYFIKTFGCQMNEYDSDKMRHLLEHDLAMTAASTKAEASVIVLNTCAIREKAQEKVFHELGRIKHLKKENPDLLIVVAGCVASQEGDQIIKRAPYVDIVLGPQTIHRLPSMLRARRQTGHTQVDIRFPEIEKFDQLPEPSAEGVSAFVSIMEGCSKYCSYCIVPYTRGEEVSRPFDDVMNEVLTLSEQGVREVTLLGQNVNHYLGKMNDGATADLALLIRTIAHIEAIWRIRFTTSHPVEFSTRLIEAYRDVPKLANHLHLPVQSGADRVLSRMKRGHTVLEYKSKIRALRAYRNDIAISTDLIVGFPGETEAEFAATLKLVEEVGFDQSFSFVYSPRPGTPAAELADDTPREVKFARLKILQNKLTEQAKAVSEGMIGTIQSVIVHGVSAQRDDELMARTQNNRVVNFKADQRFIGQMVACRITESRTNTLRGEMV